MTMDDDNNDNDNNDDSFMLYGGINLNSTVCLYFSLQRKI